MIIRKASDPNGTSTLITSADEKRNGVTPTCVASLERLAHLEIRSKKLQGTGPRLAGRVMSCLEKAGITTFNTTESANGQSIQVLVKQVNAQSDVQIGRASCRERVCQYV